MSIYFAIFETTMINAILTESIIQNRPAADEVLGRSLADVNAPSMNWIKLEDDTIEGVVTNKNPGCLVPEVAVKISRIVNETPDTAYQSTNRKKPPYFYKGEVSYCPTGSQTTVTHAFSLDTPFSVSLRNTPFGELIMNGVKQSHS